MSVIFHTCSSYPKSHWIDNECFRVVSVDPGIVNFCIRIEDRYRDGRVSTVWTDKITLKDYVYVELINYLNTLHDIISNAHYYIVERQMKENYNAIRISQHVISYFMLLQSREHSSSTISTIEPLIIEIDSKAKYWNAPKGLNKTALKKWGQDEAKRLLTMRGEIDLVNYINNSRGVRGQKKQDDLCDVIIQAEAFFKLYPIC